MAIIANVTNGKLDEKYTTPASQKTEPQGTNLGYDQFLQLLCAEMQYQDPLEPTSNTDYVAQLATFSELEATLSQTTAQQSTMANNLVGKEVIIKHEDTSTGKTYYVDGRVDYTMYKDGEIYLSVQDGLYPLSELDTVADGEYYEAVALGKSFTNMVSQLPDVENLTTAYKGAIEELRDMYDGMTSYQQQFVSDDDLKVLRELEERLEELLKAEEEKKTEAGEDLEIAEGDGESTKADDDVPEKTEEA